jgi:uncharacterized linocin/CFP29 family protein
MDLTFVRTSELTEARWSEINLEAAQGYKGRITGNGFRGLASTTLHEQGLDHQHELH